MIEMEKLTKSIAKIAKDFALLGKQTSLFEKRKVLESINKTATEIDLNSLTSTIDNEILRIQTELDRHLARRRDAMCKAADERKLYWQSSPMGDSVDVFKVKENGFKVTIIFAGVEIEKLEEYDGEKVVEHLVKLRKDLTNPRFDRADFFRSLFSAYTSAFRRSPSRDGFVTIDVLYLEFLFERATSNASFFKNGSCKHLPDYPFHQFLFDLSRFLREGVTCETGKIQTRTPSMSENSKTYSLPNLDSPSAPPQILHLLSVTKN
jgi:hypothetical protein